MDQGRKFLQRSQSFLKCSVEISNNFENTFSRKKNHLKYVLDLDITLVLKSNRSYAKLTTNFNLKFLLSLPASVFLKILIITLIPSFSFLNIHQTLSKIHVGPTSNYPAEAAFGSHILCTLINRLATDSKYLIFFYNSIIIIIMNNGMLIMKK